MSKKWTDAVRDTRAFLEKASKSAKCEHKRTEVWLQRIDGEMCRSEVCMDCFENVKCELVLGRDVSK